MATEMMEVPASQQLSNLQLNELRRMQEAIMREKNRFMPDPRDIARLQQQMMMSPPRPLSGYIPDKPSTDMLQHMHTPELNGSGRQALAVEVEDLLGYTPLRKDAGAPSRLQRFLAELEIEAFDPATVFAYKDKMRAHFQARADAEDQRRNAGLFDGNMFGRHMYRTNVQWRTVKLSAYTKPIPEFVLRKCVEIKKHAPEANFFVDELVQERQTLDPFLWVTLRPLEALEATSFEDCCAIEVWDEPEFEKQL